MAAKPPFPAAKGGVKGKRGNRQPAKPATSSGTPSGTTMQYGLGSSHQRANGHPVKQNREGMGGGTPASSQHAPSCKGMCS